MPPPVVIPHPFPNIACLRVVNYVQTPRRVMSFESYWQPETTPLNPTLMAFYADNFMADIGALWAPLAADTCQLAATYVRYTDETHDFDAWAPTAPIDGTNHALVGGNDEWEPEFMCALIRRLTGKRGRHMRGRMFIPGICEAVVSKGRFTIPIYAALHDIAAFFGADRVYGAGTFHARHWSRKTDDLVVVTKCQAMEEVYTRRDRSIRGIRLPVPS